MQLEKRSEFPFHADFKDVIIMWVAYPKSSGTHSEECTFLFFFTVVQYSTVQYA